MKNVIAILLLASTVLPAQTGKKCGCKSTVPETIPQSAVVPAYKNSEPYCPRAEYELQWFVEENVSYEPSVVTMSGTYITSGSTSYSTKKILVFTPMCVEKKDVQQ